MEDSEKETITIPCPHCHETHEYPLKVSRSISIGFLALDSFRKEEPQKKRFRRYFICPSTNQKFQATLQLLEWPREKINEVEVGKPI